MSIQFASSYYFVKSKKHRLTSIKVKGIEIVESLSHKIQTQGENWRMRLSPTLLGGNDLVYSSLDLVKIYYFSSFMYYHVQYEIHHLSAHILCLNFHHYQYDR